jgi:two-component sensor histidine kinase
MLDDAVLLVSELVTNAVLHGAPPITVHIECDGGRELLVSVADEDPRSPVLRDGGPGAESGRGIRLVDVVSDRWGVVNHPDDGKRVWFRLRS